MDPQTDYPYPIAVALEALRRAESDGTDDRLPALLRVHDGVVRTLALLALASYVDQGPQSASVDMLLQRRFLAKALKSADWGDLLHQLVRPLRSSSDRCAVPELVKFWISATGRLTPHAQALSRLAPVRVRWEQNRLGVGEAERLCAEFRPLVDAAFEQLDFLRSVELYVPLSGTPVDRSHVHVQTAIACRGTQLRQVEVDLVVGTPVRMGREVVVARSGQRAEALRLYPLMVPRLGVAGQPDDLFVYERNRRANYARGLVTRVDYVGARTGASLVVGRRSPDVDICHSFMERLGRWITDNPEVDEVEPIADDAVFAREAAADGPFVGRDVVVDRLESGARAGGLYVVVGAAGAGKSALLRHLCSRLNPTAAHFVSPDLGRDQGRLVARSLLAQVLRRSGRFGSLPESYGAASSELHAQLLNAPKTGEPSVIVIDDVDRLVVAGTRGSVSLIPDLIPAHVAWIVSCAPGPCANALCARDGAHRVELGPMDELELLALVDSDDLLDTAHREVACAAAQGTPLGARVLSMGGASVATELDDAFAGRADRVAREAPGVDGPQLCALLAASRGGLSPSDVARIFDVSAPVAGVALGSLGPLVVSRGERFVLFHDEAARWALGTLDAAGRSTVHERLADLLAQPEMSSRVDTLVHGLGHMENAGQSRRFLDALDGEFLRTKLTVLGSLEGVRDDLAQGVGQTDDLLRASRLALTAALLTRGASVLAEQGALAALSRHGDPRIAAAVARTLDDLEARSRALRDIAEEAGEYDPGYASGLGLEAGSAPAPGGAQGKAGAPAQEALRARPGSARPTVQKAVGAALADAGRDLRVRTLVAAATGLRPDRVTVMTRRALAEIQAEPTEDGQGRLLALVVAALRRVSPEDAVQAADLLPRGGHRVTALLAAGQLIRAESEARAIRKADERERALCAVMDELVQSDPVRAMAGARQLLPGPERDAILGRLSACLEAELAAEAAAMVAAPPLRAAALARAKSWDDAVLCVDGCAGGAEMALAAYLVAVHADARRQPELAQTLRGRAHAAAEQLPPNDRAQLLYDVADHVRESSGELALQWVEKASGLDQSPDGQRRAAFARARILVAHPSGERALEAMRITAPWGDAYAEIHVCIVAALSRCFGARFPEVVLAAAENVFEAERRVADLLCVRMMAGTRIRKMPPVPVSGGIAPNIAAVLLREPWEPVDTFVGDDRDELPDLEEILLGNAGLDAADVERLLAMYQERGDEEATVGLLIRWARVLAETGDPAAANDALQQAAHIDPLDPRLAEEGIADLMMADDSPISVSPSSVGSKALTGSAVLPGVGTPFKAVGSLAAAPLGISPRIPKRQVSIGPPLDPNLPTVSEAARTIPLDRNRPRDLPASVRFSIVVDGPDQLELVHTFETNKIKIGRHTSNDLVLRSGSVSRFHATIEIVDGAFRVADLASSNGSFVNKVKVVAPHPVAPGDSVGVGDFTLRLKLPDASTGPDPFETADTMQLQDQAERIREAAAGALSTLEIGGTLQNGRYKVLRAFGEGTYSAFDVSLERQVVIKMLAALGDDPETSGVHRGAQMLIKVRHPNLVTVFDVGVRPSSREPYIVMELLVGHDLEAEIETRGPLSIDRALALFAPALEALAEAHDAHVVHAGLKPSQFFLTDPGTPSERLIVLNTGFSPAYLLQEGAARGQLFGDPRYMAPEYAQHQHVSAQLDVYQAALVFIESLTGMPVVQGNPAECLMKHVQGRISLPRGVASGPLGSALRRALAATPAGRFPDTRVFARALRHAHATQVASEPVLQVPREPPSGAQRTADDEDIRSRMAGIIFHEEPALVLEDEGRPLQPVAAPPRPARPARPPEAPPMAPPPALRVESARGPSHAGPVATRPPPPQRAAPAAGLASTRAVAPERSPLSSARIVARTGLVQRPPGLIQEPPEVDNQLALVIAFALFGVGLVTFLLVCVMLVAFIVLT